MAESWDLFRGDTSNWADRRLYLEIVRRHGEPVLDLGCGTGRILLDFLALGIDIDGVDNSPEMLALCRAKAAGSGLRPQVYEQTMQSLDLPRRYRTILVPSSSFQLLLDPADARAAMGRFVRHLLPGGVLVMPFMPLWREGDPLERAFDLTAQAVRPSDGATIRRWSRTWFEPAAQLEHTEDRYELVVDGDVVYTETHLQSPAVRGYRQDQALALYRAAGLVDLQSLSVFTWEPAKPDDWAFTVLGQRPS
jgi:ubiquinone/menaquinone biosynthesis C-methylase UbiE